MKVVRRVILTAMVAGMLSACAETGGNALAGPTGEGPGDMVSRDYRIDGYTVIVPETLTVDESNRLVPGSDIVWRGDAYGPRHAQVQKILETALAEGSAALNGARPVSVDLEVTRFHSLTQRARYTTGGVHRIRFTLTVSDAVTGEVIEAERPVDGSFRAFGGRRAVAEENLGNTQKLRILEHLSQLLHDELS